MFFTSVITDELDLLVTHSECVPGVDAVALGLLLLPGRDSSTCSRSTAAVTPEGFVLLGVGATTPAGHETLEGPPSVTDFP